MNFDARTRDYDDSAHKLLHDQRDAYIAQSAASRDGNVAEFEKARRYAAEQAQDAQDNDYREGFAAKYGTALGAD